LLGEGEVLGRHHGAELLLLLGGLVLGRTHVSEPRVLEGLLELLEGGILAGRKRDAIHDVVAHLRKELGIHLLIMLVKILLLLLLIVLL
jgi:hypothetical protein